MRRPIGVILLAAGAGLLALVQIYRIFVYLGILEFPVGEHTVSFDDGAVGRGPVGAHHGRDLGLGGRRLLEPARVRGPVRHLHQPLHPDLGLLRAPLRVHVRGRDDPWLLAGAIFLYLSYPGVQKAFYDNEISKLTPEQVAAMDALAAANAAAGAKPAPGMGTPDQTT